MRTFLVSVKFYELVKASLRMSGAWAITLVQKHVVQTERGVPLLPFIRSHRHFM